MIAPVSLLGSLGTDVVGTARKAQEAIGASFSDTLNQVVSQGIATVRGGEATAVKGIEGSATTQEVVDAVMSAERTMQTAVAIRDKLVSAFQEISRMPI
jgi:flagellar hook-basal body complex protein FliE